MDKMIRETHFATQMRQEQHHGIPRMGIVLHNALIELRDRGSPKIVKSAWRQFEKIRNVDKVKILQIRHNGDMSEVVTRKQRTDVQ